MEVKMSEIHCEKIEEFSEEGRKFLRYWGTFSLGGNNISIFIPRLSLDLQGLELTQSLKLPEENLEAKEPYPYLYCSTKQRCFALTLEQDKNEVFFQLERREEACE